MGLIVYTVLLLQPSIFHVHFKGPLFQVVFFRSNRSCLTSGLGRYIGMQDDRCRCTSLAPLKQKTHVLFLRSHTTKTAITGEALPSQRASKSLDSSRLQRSRLSTSRVRCKGWREKTHEPPKNNPGWLGHSRGWHLLPSYIGIITKPFQGSKVDLVQMSGSGIPCLVIFIHGDFEPFLNRCDAWKG